jgi:uncharacterized membrane protein HdeD (DUF308 family)
MTARERHDHAAGPTGGEMLEEVVGIVTGLGVMLLPLLVLSVPALVLLLPLVVLGLPLVIGGALLVPPYLLVRSVRRRPRGSSAP